MTDRHKWQTFVEVCYYEREAKSGLNGQIEAQGGQVCGVVEVPKYNVAGQPNGIAYAVVYQAPQELSLEIWT